MIKKKMSEKRAIIHIGMHKAGSSSIQNTLDKASDKGQLADIAYQNKITHKKLGNNLLPTVYKELSEAPRGIKNKYAGNERKYKKEQKVCRAKFSGFLKKNRKIVLSSEHLIGFRKKNILDLRNDLSRAGIENTKIVLYIRNPADYYLSAVQQILKASKRIRPPAEFRYNYKSIIENWRDVFPGAILVRPFDRSELYQNCVVQDFLHILSKELDVVDLPQKLDVIETNQSISAEAMLILQQYRHLFYPDSDDVFKEDSSKLVKLLERSRENIYQTPPELKKNIRNMILNNHIDILEWLKDSYDISFCDLTKQKSIAKDASAFQATRLDEIIDAYDPDILNRLLFYCMNKALNY